MNLSKLTVQATLLVNLQLPLLGAWSMC